MRVGVSNDPATTGINQDSLEQTRKNGHPTVFMDSYYFIELLNHSMFRNGDF